jgi:hypothetical protein
MQQSHILNPLGDYYDPRKMHIFKEFNKYNQFVFID